MPGFRQGLAYDEVLLEELVARVAQFKSLVCEFMRPFHYLERYYVPANRAVGLQASGLHAFRDAICAKVKTRLMEALANFMTRQDQEPQKRPLVCKVRRIKQCEG